MGLICLVEIGEVRRVKCVHVRGHVRVLCCIQMRVERETDITTRNVQSLCLRSLAVTLPCTEPPEKDEPCEATERDGARLEVGVPGFEAPPSERVIFRVVFISARLMVIYHCTHTVRILPIKCFVSPSQKHPNIETEIDVHFRPPAHTPLQINKCSCTARGAVWLESFL